MATNSSETDPWALANRLANYGCTDIIRLDEKLTRPEQLDYLDLLPTRSNSTSPFAAVAAHQGTALLYVVDAVESTSSNSPTIAELSRQLANRSDPAWLGVLKRGSLEIYPIGFHEPGDVRPVSTIHESDVSAPMFFQSLVHGTLQADRPPSGTDYVYKKIFKLLEQTTEAFVPREGKGPIESLDVLSMAGRALFFRFLIDRRIVQAKELHGIDGICPSASELKDAFSSAEKAARTSAWLDKTFNGDFLPLIDERIGTEDLVTREKEYLKFYKEVGNLTNNKIFFHLHAILRGWHAVGEHFQTEFDWEEQGLDWADFNFAHIPVGVLSQVYESFSHRADPRTSRDTSVHYTPRTIANFMVNEAFAAVKGPADAKVLDSACGAGIFLVLAFRRLVRERWLRDGERPRTSTIQDILYKQVRGFDVSESALRLAALGLYITAIELNASPRPPQSLKFPRNLRGEVLYRFGGENHGRKSTAFSIGSLGPDVPAHFDRSFDIVIGNPPWTPLKDEKEEGSVDARPARGSDTDGLSKQFTEIGRRVLRTRGFPDLAKRYENPAKNPDLPFLWRSTEWVKEDGVIALAMHARLFMRGTGKGRTSWNCIVQSIGITGILNGSDLRQTAVWEGMKAPFCLLFARNIVPQADHCFQFATPHFEPNLNERGRLRIDYEAAQQVSVGRVREFPWLLKTLSLGTGFDVDLMERIEGHSWSTLGEYWKGFDKSLDSTGQGYNRSPNLPQKRADFLGKLPDFSPSGGFTIDFDRLITYQEQYGVSTAYWPKTEHLYRPPLVIIPQSPGDDDTKPRAYISDQAIAFSQSYYGYSCAGHADEKALTSLLYLLAHSKLFTYFCLMISNRTGFDRQTFNKEEFDALPFPDIVTLPESDKATLRELADRLQHDTAKPWDEINSFLFRLYGFDADDVQVAADTLFASASYRTAGRDALGFTDRAGRTGFLSVMREELEPYFDVCGEQVHVAEVDIQADDWEEPWIFLRISPDSRPFKVNSDLMRKAMDLANQSGSSRILVRAPGKRGLLLGLLNRRRWWTITRARLCSQHIIRNHLDAFGLVEDA